MVIGQHSILTRLSFRACLAISLVLLSACASRSADLYQDFGGQSRVNEVTELLIDEIGYDKAIYAYFAESDIDRFREKFSEHLCQQLGGPCQYTGDSMKQSHQGMGVSEADFNRLVDLLINAMNRADVPHRVQNRLLSRLAPMRVDIIE